MSNQRIVHFFNSKNIHLNPSIILGINDNSESRHDHIFIMNSLNDQGESIDTSVYDVLIKKGLKIIFVHSFLSLVLMVIRERGVLVFHGAISPFKKHFLLLFIIYFFYRKVLRGIVLVGWAGADFDPEIGSFSAMYNKILKNVKYIVTLSRVDYELCFRLYGERAKQINYIIEKDIGLSSLSGSASLDNKRIMVSHSGWPHNKHIESFEMIKNKINESCEIICPLAYGDENYIEEVVRVGSHILGEQFIYFDKLMDIDDYRGFLKTIDIYVTSSEIQTGLFALTSCLGNGAKVYCGYNLYKSLTESGFKVYSIDELFSASEEEFHYVSNEDIDLNKSIYMKEYGDFVALKSKWNVVYDLHSRA